MFLKMLKKEWKVYVSSKINLVFMIILPIIFIGLFSVALKDYIGADYGTFEDGNVFYYVEDDGTYLERFGVICDKLTEATGVTFTEVNDLADAEDRVEASEGYGVITIKADGYDYYRSPYNETEGGKLLRTMFVQLAGLSGETLERYPVLVENVIDIKVSDVDSNAYYTFSALAFTLMMLSVGVSLSIYNERESQAIVRYRISKAGIWGMYGIKIVVGMIAGLIQIGVSFLFSTLALGVKWGDKIGYMLLLLMLNNLFAVLLAMLLGIRGKNKSMSQDTVLIITMLSAYLGGSITPIYILENIKVLRFLVRISPLYWTNQALISLYNGVLDKKTLYSALVLLMLSAILAIVIVLGEKKKRVVRIVPEQAETKEEEVQTE